MGLNALLAMIIGIGGPYVIFLGTIDVRIPYGVLGLIALIGAAGAFMLPETYGVDLPETIAEASVFGQDQKLCGWVRPKKTKQRRQNKSDENSTQEANQPLA